MTGDAYNTQNAAVRRPERKTTWSRCSGRHTERVPLSEQLCADVLTLAADARKHPLGVFHPAFSLLRAVRSSLLRQLPADAHLRASGRLCVSLTRMADGQNVLVSQFDSREELVQVSVVLQTQFEKKEKWSHVHVSSAGSPVQLLLPRLLRLQPAFVPRRGECFPSCWKQQTPE